jgi:hypothetical protein
VMSRFDKMNSRLASFFSIEFCQGEIQSDSVYSQTKKGSWAPCYQTLLLPRLLSTQHCNTKKALSAAYNNSFFLVSLKETKFSTDDQNMFCLLEFPCASLRAYVFGLRRSYGFIMIYIPNHNEVLI